MLDKQLGNKILEDDLPKDLHKLPHKDYDLTGENVHEHNFESLAVNRHAEFTERVYVDNMANSSIGSCTNNPDKVDTPKEIEFWMNESDYKHHEVINQCVKIATTNNQDYMTFNLDVTATDAPRIHTPAKRDYAKLKPYFSWIPTKLIELTFRNSTQYRYMPVSPDGRVG